MFLLGYDIGSSSVKASIVEAGSGKRVADAFYPKSEAPIISKSPGFAEQDPECWWDYLRDATAEALSKAKVEEASRGKSFSPSDIRAIGISYQMHGLVCVDKDQKVLRPAIIWCDSRAVPYGEQAANDLGREWCMEHLLNTPGNFTAAKLAWVKANEREVFGNIHKIMLPGDYIAMRLTGEINTTVSGLSEGILWDFKSDTPAWKLLDVMGFGKELLPEALPAFSLQGRLSESAAKALGLSSGTVISYRAGDQPNNALSLNVLEPGEVAATAGTSGVVYGVSDKVSHDPLSRVNTFAHVNHRVGNPRLGILLCINGTGILNAWTRKNLFPDGITYKDMNELSQGVPPGSEGLSILPFGNGAERMLGNRGEGCMVAGLDFNRHSRAHFARAVNEAVAFAFKYGMDIMEDMGMHPRLIRAGMANMFLNPVFRDTLASVTGATIELYDTDGAVGAALGAGIGAGIFNSPAEALASLKRLSVVHPVANEEAITEAFIRWKSLLDITYSKDNQYREVL